MRHSTHGRSHFLVRLACVKHAASVQSEPESNSPVQICIKSLRQSRRNQNLKVLFPFAIHLSMNQNLPPFQAASGFMPFSSSTVKNFFRFAIFFAEEFRSFSVAGKFFIGFSVFICQAIFLNFFGKLSKLPSRLALSLAPNEFARCVFNWREGGFYACGMGLSTNFCIFDKLFSHGTETHQPTL